MMIRKRNNSNSNNDNKILKSVLLVQTVLVLLSTSSINAHALEANEQTESNAFVQTLLQKTEEKREERQKERVLEYSKKNFKDYLSFVDNGKTAKTENDVKIKEWLEKNK
jgi:nucleoside-specific outer membrane channel protein Tsx